MDRLYYFLSYIYFYYSVLYTYSLYLVLRFHYFMLWFHFLISSPLNLIYLYFIQWSTFNHTLEGPGWNGLISILGFDKILYDTTLYKKHITNQRVWLCWSYKKGVVDQKRWYRIDIENVSQSKEVIYAP